MSVYRHDYVLYGWKFGFHELLDPVSDDFAEQFEDSPHSETVRSHDGISIVSDGMNSDYAYIGIVLRKVDGDGFDTDNDVEINEEMLSELKAEIGKMFNALNKNFPHVVNSIYNNNKAYPCIHIFSHYH